MEVKMEKENNLQEYYQQITFKQGNSSGSFTNLPSLGNNEQKRSSQGEKSISNRSSGGSKQEDNCENCTKNKVCLQSKCIDSQQMNFCCEKCYKRRHMDHCKDFVIDISSIDSQIRKLHQEVIDGPLFRLATDLREMTKDFNDLKKSFPSVQEIPIVEFALHSKRINQINVRSSKEDYDRMRKESIKSAIRISKIDKRNSKLKLQIDEAEIEQNTMTLLKKYEEIIQAQQQKLEEFKERTSKLFQDIKKNNGSVSNIQYQSLAVGSKPMNYLERERETQPILKERMNYINVDSQNDDNDQQSFNNSNLNSYNNINSYNSNNNNNNQSFNNSYPTNNNNQSYQQGNMNGINNNMQSNQQLLNPFMYTQSKQKGNDYLDPYSSEYKGMQQTHMLSNSMSSARFDSNSNQKGYINEGYIQQPKLEDTKRQMMYDQYAFMQKLEQNQGISQSMNSNSNNKPLSRNANNLFSESNQNNSISYSNSNLDQLRSTPYKQQKTQKKINEYFTLTTKSPKPQIKQEDQNQIKSNLPQNEKYIQQQQQQLLFYEQQKQKQQLQQHQQLQQQQQQQQQIQQQFNQQTNIPQLQQQQQLQFQAVQQQQFQQVQQQPFQQQQVQQQSKQKQLFFNQPSQNSKQPQRQEQKQEVNFQKQEQNVLHQKQDATFLKEQPTFQKQDSFPKQENSFQKQEQRYQQQDNRYQQQDGRFQQQQQQQQENNLRSEINGALLAKKTDTVFMKSDVLVIEELMKLTQSTIYTQYDEDNELRKSPSQVFSESQLQSFSNNRSVSQQIYNENLQKKKQIPNEIIIEGSQESNMSKAKQPVILNSLDLLCSEQMSEVNDQSNSNQLEMNNPFHNKSLKSDKNGVGQQFGKLDEKSLQNRIISVPSTSSLSSVSKSDHPESKVFYQQTFGAQNPQQQEEDQLTKASQDLYCWESLSNTQKDKVN